MADAIERCLAAAVAAGSCCIGEVAIGKADDKQFTLNHRDDSGREDLQFSKNADDAAEIARFDDMGRYRPLKTTPNLRHGWRLELANLDEVRVALDHLYPARLAVLTAREEDRLMTTPLRATLGRQSGMYRVAARISDQGLNDVVASFCRSDGGCLRTILWKRDQDGTVPSTKLPVEKYDASHDQTGGGQSCIPLLCQEACNLLVNECRKVVKMEGHCAISAGIMGHDSACPSNRKK
jgi:sirohydrochlorin cobaltochelatase